MSYKINEIFFSLQGEGIRAGTPNIFVRFSNCNLACDVTNQGWACDTEFESGKDMEIGELMLAMETAGGSCRNVILTGGEPALQVDRDLLESLKAQGWHIAIETNGTRELPEGIDWVCVSPKTALHTIKVARIDELKMVRTSGQYLPDNPPPANYYLVSPAFTSHGLDKETLDWCINLVKENPQWRLSMQLHKLIWQVR